MESFFYNESRTAVLDLQNPNVQLIYPENNFITSTRFEDYLINLYFNLSDNNNYDLLNCSLYINNIYNKSSLFSQGLNYFEAYLDEGKYNWSISCADASNNIGNSESNILFIDNLPPVGIDLDFPPESCNEGDLLEFFSLWDYGFSPSDSAWLTLNDSIVAFNNSLINYEGITTASLSFNTRGYAGYNLSFNMSINDTRSWATIIGTNVYVKDITSPQLYFSLLQDYSNLSHQVIYFNASDNVEFKKVNCSLYVNDIYNQSMLIYPNGSMQHFNLNLQDGEYNFTINCMDNDSNTVNITQNM
jgi:hypothetical protein